MNRLLLTLLFVPVPTYAQISAPIASDSGPWKIEGSAICFELKKFPSGCNEVRVAGEVLCWKRISNGEVVQLHRK